VNVTKIIQKDFKSLYHISNDDYCEMILCDPPFLDWNFVSRFYENISRKLLEGKFKLIWQKYFLDDIMSIVNQIYKLRETPQECKEYVKNLVDTHLKYIKTQTEQMKSQIYWLVDNPGTQLTSSFNPIIEEPIKWYGDLLLLS
jgi:hypothetical protein